MLFTRKLLGAAAVATVASFGLAGAAHADVCDTPSSMGDLGRFDGEIIAMMGSM